MKPKHLPLAAALLTAAPAFAISVNLTDFSFPGAPDVSVTDTLGGPSYNGPAGRFDGTRDDAALAASAFRSGGPNVAATSFVAYCAELTQTFEFNVTYTDYGSVAGSSYWSAQKASDLSKLFTVASGFVVDSATSAAMQAAVWEIIYQSGSSYDVFGGTFKVAPNDASYLGAFATANGFLGNLGSVAAFKIDVLVSPSAQDFLVVTAIPEPGTWALLIAGLGVLGFVARGRKAA